VNPAAAGQQYMDARWLWHLDFDPPAALRTTETLAESIEWNKHLIRELHARGYNFLDIGPRGEAATSPYYKAELDVLRELGITATPWTNPADPPKPPQ
jgi:hypothetical protein